MSPLPGYLSLHQSVDGLTLKWTPNQLMNGCCQEEKEEADVDRRWETAPSAGGIKNVCRWVWIYLGYYSILSTFIRWGWAISGLYNIYLVADVHRRISCLNWMSLYTLSTDGVIILLSHCYEWKAFLFIIIKYFRIEKNNNHHYEKHYDACIKQIIHPSRFETICL